MKLLIVGAGMMGRRHIRAVLDELPQAQVVISDLNRDVMSKVLEECPAERHAQLSFLTAKELPALSEPLDGCVVATSALHRLELLQQLVKLPVRDMLIEKPVEQSLPRFRAVQELLSKSKVHARVNLVKRVFSAYQKMKKMMHDTPQFEGKKFINIYGGAIGIGCNGTHLADLVMHLVDATSYKLVAAHISDVPIASGRGVQYGDFGGWAVFELFNALGENNAQLNMNLSAESTAPYTISILGRHARLDIDEIRGEYSFTMRNSASTLPMYRYFGDYEEFKTCPLNLEGVGCGVGDWLNGITDKGESKLPTIDDSSLVHELIFEWLGHSKLFKEPFPIT